MKVEGLSVLAAAIPRITDWRTEAIAAGINLDQVNLTLGDGSVVVLVWDNVDGGWTISIR
jgi:hypothetical protein